MEYKDLGPWAASFLIERLDFESVESCKEHGFERERPQAQHEFRRLLLQLRKNNGIHLDSEGRWSFQQTE
jgi:hypothetical protein